MNTIESVLRIPDLKAFNRACTQLDNACISYEYERETNTLTYEGDAAACKVFVSVALFDPNAKNYR